MSSNPVEALRQTPNQSFRPTYGLSLRSSPAAANFNVRRSR